MQSTGAGGRYVKKLRSLFGVEQTSCTKSVVIDVLFLADCCLWVTILTPTIATIANRHEYMEFRDTSTTSRRYGLRITNMSVAKFQQPDVHAVPATDSASNGGGEFLCKYRGTYRVPAPNNRAGLDWYNKIGQLAALKRSLVRVRTHSVAHH